ncbi:MAG: phosphate ABC transporter permease subunit PstC [Thermoleophilia bacterium]|nr:phosphate ABC transporter permease subunit PstC [Thermoleophilia bacterium]
MTTSSAGVEPLGSAPARRSLRRPLAGLVADRAYLIVTALAAAAALTGIGYLIWTTVSETGDIWSTFGVWGFLTGTEWVPTPADGVPVFGAAPFIYGTLVTSAIAMALAVPLAIGVALATTVILPARLRAPVSAVVDLLAAVPSVVYGLWGILVLVPAARPVLEWIAENSGGIGAFAGPVTSGSFVLAGLVLAVMVLPIIAAISREVLETVPREQQEAAYALGATRWEMVRSAMLPWSRSGIVGASALGLGRAVGETIAIALLLGNSPVIWESLLGPGATLSSVIALEFGEASNLQLSALIALSVILFALSFAINALARLLVGRTAAGPGPVRRALAGRRSGGLVPAGGGPAQPVPEPPVRAAGLPSVSRGRRVRSGIAEGGIYAALVISLIPLGLILGKILVEGLPAISWSFFTELPPADPYSEGGISSALVGTLILMGLATLFSAPLGILVALFINDAAANGGPRMRRLGAGVGFVIDVLLGMPSIVAGLIVYLGVVIAMGHFSALAGGIALGIIMFPIVVRSADEILRLVPTAQKEAALALGAPRWRTIWSVVLPAAAPGILTGVMLALARASGETAPLLFTSLSNQFFSTDVLEPIAALPQLIFSNSVNVQTPQSLELAWGAALVLVAVILLLNIVARLVAARARPSEGR